MSALPNGVLHALQVPGTQAAFINYVVCLAVVQGIKDATQHLVQVRLQGRRCCNHVGFGFWLLRRSSVAEGLAVVMS
jgi:hypothetical protein